MSDGYLPPQNESVNCRVSVCRISKTAICLNSCCCVSCRCCEWCHVAVMSPDELRLDETVPSSRVGNVQAVFKQIHTRNSEHIFFKVCSSCELDLHDENRVPCAMLSFVPDIVVHFSDLLRQLLSELIKL